MVTTSEDDEVTRLAVAAGAGDRRALEAFVRRTQREVWRFVAHLVDVGTADDLTQETYLRALPSLPRFAARSSARTWPLSIARRVVVDTIRSARVRPRRSPSADWATAAEAGQARAQANSAGFEDLVELNLVLAALEPDRRTAIVLTQVLGFSYAEAAEVTGVPVGTVRSRVARARDDLTHQWQIPFTGTR